MRVQRLSTQTCNLCENDALVPMGLGRTKGVTSDCKPWPQSGEVLLCTSCGHVQKLMDEAWSADVQQIYRQYEIYSLSGGAEQVVFSGAGPKARSAVVLEGLVGRVALPESGRLLDIGCGNGALLRSFRNLRPAWAMVGADHNEGFRDEIVSIPGVEHFSSGFLDAIPGSFDLVTMLEVLEHIREPVACLKEIRRSLRPEGIVLIQVPDYRQNPFDLMIMDHSSHFSSATLALTAAAAGLEVVFLTTAFVAKELTMVARLPRTDVSTAREKPDPPEAASTVRYRLEWLNLIVEHARHMSRTANFGIFGTAIAGTWLANNLGELVRFFVDEDRMRSGKVHMGRPVFLPEDVPEDASVYLAFPPNLANRIQERLGAVCPGVAFMCPPSLPPCSWTGGPREDDSSRISVE